MWKSIIVVITMTLVGCEFSSHPNEDLFDDYLQRIARVQGQDALLVEKGDAVTIPDKRELYIEIEPLSIGLLDSYQLRNCGLFELIAEKNSIMGKVQDPFRDFDYQNSLIAGLQHCVNNPQVDVELRNQLSIILAKKQQHIASHFANLLFASDAMRNQFAPNGWIDQRQQAFPNQLITAFDVLLQTARSFNQPYSLDASFHPITVHQETLDKAPMLGKLWYSLTMSTAYLNTVTRQLNFYDSRVVCKVNRDKKQFRYLNNVFNRTYVTEVQPYLANLDKLYIQIEPLAKLLQTAHPDYQYPLVSAHQAFRKATLDHVQYWQSLFKRCGVSVGQ
ncbi:DUF3080 domain-containing protein [Vibrio intestinalis]|uniref:DUF3080 domain-containing protein n=1 Tax=Vibrio intestinalis TaxID=2933291 RepID=UPI0021A7B9D2|nr:DUF3080 domain-containing protein [Vibrio intestinalis]